MPRREALVTPAVLRWAREKAGYDVPTAARKIGRPESEVEAWENGSLRPTFAQARRASEVYKRSLSVFYLPDPPRDLDTLRDFRTLPTGHPRRYSPELALLIRQLRVRQAWLRDFLESQGADRFPFIGSARLATPPTEVAQAIRGALSVSADEQTACRSRHMALSLWIRKAESAGICVCRQGGIECEEVRGLLLTDAHAPFVYLNSSDAAVGQLFTLAHELAHLWINEPGISNLLGIGRTGVSPGARIEVFCNAVAAESLVDQETFSGLWASVERGVPLEKRIEELSGDLKVSEEVIARRLLDRGLIREGTYRRLRGAYAERWLELKQREKAKLRESPGGPSYYVVKMASNGRRFTQTVVEAYHTGVISGREASGLLGVKINHLAQLSARAETFPGLLGLGGRR